MKLVEAHARIHPLNDSYEHMLRRVADAVALCYKADKGDTVPELEKFVRARIDAGHVSVIEHAVVTAEILTDRSITHEIVRHRLASYTQESTRYCNYSKDKFENQLTFVIPEWMHGERGYGQIANKRFVFEKDGGVELWSLDGKARLEFPELSPLVLEYLKDMLRTERKYMRFLELGLAPEEARGRLTNDLAASIVMTANVREWRHVFELRALGTTGRPHPSIRNVMGQLLKQFGKEYPVFFADLAEKFHD